MSVDKAQFMYQQFEAPAAARKGTEDVQVVDLDEHPGYRLASWQAVTRDGRSFIIVLWERRLGT